MPNVRDRVKYRSVTGEPIAYDAIVMDVHTATVPTGTLGTTVILDVVVPGCRDPMRRTKIPWSDDPGCTTPGWAHPKAPA